MTINKAQTAKRLTSRPMLRRKLPSVIVFNVIAYVVVILIVAFCLLPFVAIISGSLTDNAWISTHGFSLIPQKFSVKAYTTIFTYPKDVLSAYAVTTCNTIAGTAVGLLFISMAGYVLSRKGFKYRNTLMFFIYFTTLFGGGLVPWYIMIIKFLNLKNNFIAIWYPLLMSPFLIILMRTFISSAFPDEVMESAIIDGAGYFRIYRSIVLPIITPGLAAVGLLLALNYWNDWFLSSLFITTPGKRELQYYLYNLINGAQEIYRLSTTTGASISTNDLPIQSVKLAMAVVATGPVLFFYPLVQRYFIAGITIGAVKG